MKKGLKIVLYLAIGLFVIFLLIQLVPLGRNHTNPAVVSEPNWDSPQTRTLAKQACFDCHSNETVWPWYSNIAPVSWLVYFDTMEGRSRLNFSDWGRYQVSMGEIIGVLQEGEMPPFQYLLMHPKANLNTQDRQALIDGLTLSLK